MMIYHFRSVFLNPDYFGSPEKRLFVQSLNFLTHLLLTMHLVFNYSKKINRRVLKKNPLKNLRIMLKLNPYAKTARRHAILKHNPEVGHLSEMGNMFTVFLG